MACHDAMPLAICPPATRVPAIRMAATTPLKETMASTDRSMPPVRMTNVWPAATTPMAAASSASSMTLVGERNAGAVTHRNTPMINSTNSGPVLPTIRLMELPARRAVLSALVAVWLMISCLFVIACHCEGPQPRSNPWLMSADCFGLSPSQ